MKIERQLTDVPTITQFNPIGWIPKKTESIYSRVPQSCGQNRFGFVFQARYLNNFRHSNLKKLSKTGM